MAHIESQPLELFARDIVRYSDAELDQYLEANGRSNFPNFMISASLRFTQQVRGSRRPRESARRFHPETEVTIRSILASSSCSNNTVVGPEQARAIRLSSVRLISATLRHAFWTYLPIDKHRPGHALLRRLCQWMTRNLIAMI